MKPSLIILGLGNVGKEYVGTRHNVGFTSSDILAEEFGTGEFRLKQKFIADVCEGRIVTVPILIVKPTTYMNRSGECAKKMVDFYRLDPAKELIVLCDDIDLPVGAVRFRSSGGPGTHNGLKSLTEQFGEDFPRVRIGIGAQKPGEDLSAYVLSVIPKEDKIKIDEGIANLPQLIRSYVLDDQGNSAT